MSDPSLSVILTVHNRPVLTLLNTLAALAKCDLTDTRILIVDDGSDADGLEALDTALESLPDMPVTRLSWDTEAHRETYTLGDGHNNPAAANNVALKWCEDERIEQVFWLSSDCIVPSDIFRKARNVDLTKYVYVPSTIDMDTSMVYCGKTRIFPAMWFVGTTVDACRRAGGFDEEYIRGMAFEDPDFMGRLCLTVGRLIIDLSTVVIHQSHPAIYYTDGGEGYRRSEEYTIKKWGGVPWSQNPDDPIKWHWKEVGKHLIGKVECVGVDAECIREQVGA